MYRGGPIHRRGVPVDQVVEQSNAMGPVTLASLRPMSVTASPKRPFLA